MNYLDEFRDGGLARHLAAAIPKVGTPRSPCFVEMATDFGGNRPMDWLNSDPLPRIC
jgi:hypothetical protein